MTVGELFGLCREIRGLTLRDVEKATGSSNAFLSQVESGKVKDLSLRNALMLCDFYGITLERVATLLRTS
jgi:HTH-type transcriptional regulator, competence development regulator